MSINPVEACGTHAERLGGAIAARDDQLQRIEDAYAAALADVQEAEGWEEMVQGFWDILGVEIGEVLDNWLDVPRNIDELIDVFDALGGTAGSLLAGFASALDASNAYDNWNEEYDRLGMFEDNIEAAGADYRNCIRKASLAASRRQAND